MRMKRLGLWCIVLLPAVASLGAAGRNTLLVEAVKKADTASVHALLQQRVDVNGPEVDGTTALHWAVHKDDLDTANVLIRAGANVQAANRYGITPLSLAATNGNAAMLETLLKAGADPNGVVADGETALMTAARTGTPAALKTLIAHGADVNAKESWRGQTVLMWAAAESHLAATQVLIGTGADVNARSKAGYTPLMFAARSGAIDVTETLLAAGANINDAEPRGKASVLEMAISNARWELAVVLLEKGANPNANGTGWTALHSTLMVRRPEWNAIPSPVPTGKLDSLDMIKALLAHGADPNARMTKRIRGYDKNGGHFDQLGATPFLLAASIADVPVMRLLLAAGIDPLARTKNNATSLMAAAGTGYTQGKTPGPESEALEAVRMTLELGNDVNAVDDAGYTAMHGASMRGANTIVQFLFDKGGRLDAVNEKGQIPLTIAAEGDGSNSGVQAQPKTAALFRQLMGLTTPTTKQN